MSMRKNVLLVLSLFVFVSASLARPEYFSPVALAVDKEGKTLYVAEATADKVAIVDVASGKVTKQVKLSGAPTGVAMAPDGMSVYVTIDGPDGLVDVIKTQKTKVDGSISAGHSPVAPVPSRDGKLLYVCNRFNNNVGVIDLVSGKQTDTIAVTREPVAMTITPDGAFLFVANLLPSGQADGDYVAAIVSVIDAAAKKVVAEVKLPNGSGSLRGICVSPDGRDVYVVHTLSRYQLPTTQLERGWMNTSAISIIDAAGRRLVNTVLLDDVNKGAANPWDVSCTADGKTICISHGGTHEISLINREGLHAKLDKAAKGEKVSDASSGAADVPNDLSFLVGLRNRVKLTGNGPRGLAVLGAKVYAALYFSDTVECFDVNPEGRMEPKVIELGPKQELTVVRKGEMFFSDAALCFQEWQSCLTCHPDVRTDAMNWDLLNDGIGNPKQTKSMLLSHKTGPAMISGIRESAEMAVRKGIQFIQFAVRPDEDSTAIDEFLKTLKPVPSPYLVKGKLSPAAKRGKKVFEQAQCSSCHTSPLFTDLKPYDVGTGIGSEKAREFDTPTLVEIWRTAPYLYDGRAATIEDVIGKDNKTDMHGKTSNLTNDQKRDLVEYVLSL